MWSMNTLNFQLRGHFFYFCVSFCFMHHHNKTFASPPTLTLLNDTTASGINQGAGNADGSPAWARRSQLDELLCTAASDSPSVSGMFTIFSPSSARVPLLITRCIIQL